MDPARLRPHHSRANSQSDDYTSDHQSSDDGYDYNIVDDAPEAKPTIAKEIRPANSLQASTEASASKGLGDADHAFTETMPHIWQRQVGGRRAKIPEIDLDLEKGVNDSGATNAKRPSKTASEVTSIRLRWTMPEIKNQRVLQLSSGRPDSEVQEQYLQRRRVRWL